MIRFVFPNEWYKSGYILEQRFESSDGGGGHKFYRDRVKEVYKPFYTWFHATLLQVQHLVTAQESWITC